MTCQTPGTGETAIGRQCFRVGRAQAYPKESQQCVNLRGQAEEVRESFLQLSYESSGFPGSQNHPDVPRHHWQSSSGNFPNHFLFFIKYLFGCVCACMNLYTPQESRSLERPQDGAEVIGSYKLSDMGTGN